MLLILFLYSLNVTTRIDSVIIYPDRALVSRTASIYLDKAVDLVFSDLPGLLDDNAIKIKSPGLKVGEVQITRGYTKEPHPRVKELQAKIKELELKDRRLNDENNVLKEKEKFLVSIATGASDVISKEIYTGKVAPQSWQQGLQFMVDGLLQTKARIVAIELEKAEIQEKIQALQTELNDVRAVEENRKVISFDVHPEKAGTYTLRLEYLVSGAHWRTYYELRANPSEKKIMIAYYGKIAQKTAEDWENVKIVLSTARPASGQPPSYGPWYIYSYVPPMKAGRMEEYEMAKQIAAPAPVSGEISIPTEAPVVEAGMSIWYPLPGRHTLKSGDPEKKLLVSESDLAATFEYFILPRIEQMAFSTGRMTNNSEYLFLAGDANTYVGDDFTGKTYLNSVAPGESTVVSFGVDERVKVNRKLIKSKVSSGGIFKTTKKYELSFENSIRNFHTKDITCMIVDQVPVSQNPDIKVGDIKFNPKPTEENKEQGIYYWRLDLTQGQEAKITVSFTVEAPEKVTIQNLMY